MWKFVSGNKISKLPSDPGVYSFKNQKREFLYIGKASCLKERIKNHFQQPSYRDNLFIHRVKKIGFIKTGSEIEALILEANLIKKYQPKYNTIWRDDKNYFFVAATREDFPRIFWTHQIKLKTQIPKIKVQYVGPFVDGKALKETLKILRRAFPYRSCKKIPNRPCLWYQLGRCPAACLLRSGAGKQISTLFAQIKKESQKNAKNLLKIFQGKKTKVLKDLKQEMKRLASSKHFEQAAKVRDQIKALERILAHAKIFEDLKIEKSHYFQIQLQLKNFLKTEAKIRRIEAYDISDIRGKEAAGSMVTFINGKPDKNFYRHFKIRFSQTQNDIARLKEILNRRFQHPEWGQPDLILIDGGKAQLNAAIKIKNKKSELKKIKVIALAKKNPKLYIENETKPILLKNLSSEISNLLLQLRDEAHRFAQKYHHQLRTKALFFQH